MAEHNGDVSGPQAEWWAERTYRVNLLSLEFSYSVHDAFLAFTLLLRLLMGWILLWAGFDKAINGFSAEGFLLHATSGPLHSWMLELGGSSTALSVIEPLVTYGQILLGLGIFLGGLLRLALIFAAIMMFLFYIAQFPPEYDLFADYYLVYIVVYLMLGALGAGRLLGLDRYLERLPIVQRRGWLRFLMG